MVFKEFVIKNKEFKSRKASTIQHKLRVLMKCYTIVNFDLDDDLQTFSFMKTHKINGLKMSDPKEYFGKFELHESVDDNIILKLILEENKK